MADPTSGPLGTTASLFDLSGVDQTSYSGTTLDVSPDDNLRLVSNQLANGNASSIARAYKNGTPNPTYGPDVEMWFKLPALATTVGHGVWMTARWANPTSSPNFLQAGVEVVTGPAYNLTAYAKNNGSNSTIGTFASGVTVTAGDWFAFTIEGTSNPISMKAYKWNGTTNVWAQQGSTLTPSPSDADNLAAGLIGFEIDGVSSNFRISDVHGGTKAAGAPVNSVAPVASGNTNANNLGQTLSATTGTWTNSPTSYTYQWQRDNSGGGTFSNIAAATSSTYTTVSADIGCQIKCVVTATNSQGSASADSNILNAVTVFTDMVYTTLFAADQQVFFTAVTNAYYELLWRYDTATDTGYFASYTAGSHDISIYRLDGSGSSTLLATGNAGAAITGKKLQAAAQGETHSVYVDGTFVVAANDGTYNRVGRGGIGIGSAGTADSFGGGPGLAETIAQSGTITLSGSAASDFSYDSAASGTITLSGVAGAGTVAARSGTVTLSGSATSSFAVSKSASGTITLSGSSSSSSTHEAALSLSSSGPGTLSIVTRGSVELVLNPDGSSTITIQSD